MKAQIRLAPLPAGMNRDSEAQRVGDEIVIPASLKGQAWHVLPSDRCGDCYGRGMLTMIAHDEEVNKDENGKEKRERVSYEVTGACGCVLLAAQREESTRSLRGKPVGDAPKPRVEPRHDVGWLRSRADCMRQDISSNEEELRKKEAANRERMLPYLNRVTDLEVGAAEQMRAIEEARCLSSECGAQVVNARRLVEQAHENLREAERVSVEALANLNGHERDLETLQNALEKAKREAERARNTGGHRHRLDVLRHRLGDLRRRLTAVERVIQQETAVVETVQEAVQ